MSYKLYYWPDIPGRGEFVRLALEEAGARHRDMARTATGMAELQAILDDESLSHRPFAPPYLVDGDIIVGQTAAILLYLGDKHGLSPRDEKERLWTHQIQLTIADLVAEAHDTHHPISVGLYYEDQKSEAKRRAKAFREERIPKFLSWFEQILVSNPAGPAHLVLDQITYADLSLFQLTEGLIYAFPRRMKLVLPQYPHLAALRDAIAERPRIKAYLASKRRIPFNEDGIFRHYPELDD